MLFFAPGGKAFDGDRRSVSAEERQKAFYVRGFMVKT